MASLQSDAGRRGQFTLYAEKFIRQRQHFKAMAQLMRCCGIGGLFGTYAQQIFSSPSEKIFIGNIVSGISNARCTACF